MNKRTWRIGRFACVVAAGVGMSVFASGAWAGWVVSAETEGGGGPAGGPAAAAAGGKAGGKSPMTLKFQDKKLRIDTSKGSLISDGTSGDQIVLMHEMKMYKKITAEEMKAMMERGKKMMNQGEKTDPVKPTETGKTEKIGEFDTKEYAATLPTGQKISFWMANTEQTEKLRTEMMDAMSKLMSNMQGSVDFQSLPGFPIRTVTESPEQSRTLPNGRVVTTAASKNVQTVTGIKELAIDKSEFELPGDYKELVMPAGFGAGGGAMMPGGAPKGVPSIPKPGN